MTIQEKLEELEFENQRLKEQLEEARIKAVGMVESIMNELYFIKRHFEI